MLTQHKLVLSTTAGYFYKTQILHGFMRKLVYLFILMCIVSTGNAWAQVSSDCANAVPICNNTPVNGGTDGYGADDFKEVQTSGCLEKTLSGAIESNSAWYRFKTGAPGQLGFNIGIDPEEDWDFALYKASDCGELGDPIRCNFYDNKEQNTYIGVGEDPSAVTNNVQYEQWLEVEAGEDYYLMVNNFSNVNSGFSIQFSGNVFVTNPYDALDCSIINNLLGPPIASCDTETISLDAATDDALKYSWYKDIGNGFTVLPGEIEETLKVVEAAMYRVVVETKSQNDIISDVQVAFTKAPKSFGVSDEYFCFGEIDAYNLSEKDARVLGDQSSDEVVVTYHGTPSDAFYGTNPLSKSFPLSVGEHQIFIRTTAVENSKCFDVSEEFSITVYEPLVKDFPLMVYLCEDNTNVIIGDVSPDPRYYYQWDSGETSSSISVAQGGTYTLSIFDGESDGVCENTFEIQVVASKTPRIKNIKISELQDNNSITIVPIGEGEFEFKLNNGPYQAEQVFDNVSPGLHRVTVNDPRGCGSVTETIVVVGYSKFFTPNGDGVNDLWHISGVSSLKDPVVFIYDRYGKLIKQLTKNSIGWNGTLDGHVLPATDYWFKLSYLDTNGQRSYAKYINSHFSLKR